MPLACLCIALSLLTPFGSIRFTSPSTVVADAARIALALDLRISVVSPFWDSRSLMAFLVLIPCTASPVSKFLISLGDTKVGNREMDGEGSSRDRPSENRQQRNDLRPTLQIQMMRLRLVAHSQCCLVEDQETSLTRVESKFAHQSHV